VDYGHDNELRLAEVIFTQRMSTAPMKTKAADREKLLDQNALLALEAAHVFSQCAEGWFTEEDEEEKKP
jgi:hypothetical protein